MNLGNESETLEFKKSTSELVEGVISLSAMLNKYGEGTLYIGVKNNGDVVGQANLNENSVRDVSRKISEGISPQIIPEISICYYNDIKYIKVYVKGSDIPYSAFGKYYSRSFDTDRLLSPNALKALINRDGEADLLVTVKASNQNLTFETLKMLYFNKGIKINDSNFEKNIGLLTPTGQYNKMAELLSDQNDVYIRVVTFASRDKSVVVKRTEYGGRCLLYAVEQIQMFIEAINETKVKIGSLERVDESYFDIDVFKEAFLNSIAHTRWIEGVSPLICIFDDRIEIDSNGGLPSSLTVDDFFAGVSKPVNAKFLKILNDLGFIDQVGHGVPMIVSKYGKEAFYISKHTIRVTIPINKELINHEIVPEDLYIAINNAEIAVLDMMISNPYTKINDIKRELNISESYVNKIIAQLKIKKYIKRLGARKNGCWKVLKKYR